MAASPGGRAVQPSRWHLDEALFRKGCIIRFPRRMRFSRTGYPLLERLFLDVSCVKLTSTDIEFTYFHEAVSLGNGLVAELTGEPTNDPHAPLPKAQRDRSILEVANDVSADGPPVVAEVAPAFPEDEIYQRAIDAVDAWRTDRDRYRVLWRNCQHFARYIVTGRKTSPEVEDGLLEFVGTPAMRGVRMAASAGIGFAAGALNGDSGSKTDAGLVAGASAAVASQLPLYVVICLLIIVVILAFVMRHRGWTRPSGLLRATAIGVACGAVCTAAPAAALVGSVAAVGLDRKLRI